MSVVQMQAEEMMNRHGFLGVPVAHFSEGGRRQFITLLHLGLNPESTVLDFGCGCLRGAYWLIRFLDPSGYFGIEPARQRVQYGLQYLFPPELLAAKTPHFDHNAEFNSSVFSSTFDFFLARSIWTHTSKRQILACLDSFVRDAKPDSLFVSSYLPAQTPDEDYLGDAWVGTSHESDTPGIVRHALSWLTDQCQRRGLSVTALPELDFDGQQWLVMGWMKEPAKEAQASMQGTGGLPTP